MITIIPKLALMDVTGSGKITFQPDSSYVFNAQAGATIFKRHFFYADWTPELEGAIADYGLSMIEPIQPGDMLVIPGVDPGNFEVQDADAYPGYYIKIFTTTRPRNVPGL